MTVRSTQLVAINMTVAQGTFVYTCPAGWRTIVKDAQISYTGGTSGPAALIIALAAGYNLYLFSQTLSSSAAQYQWNGWTVLNPGDRLYMSLTAISASVIISGTLLQLTGAEPV